MVTVSFLILYTPMLILRIISYVPGLRAREPCLNYLELFYLNLILKTETASFEIQVRKDKGLVI